jgi:TPR repeat protein
VKEPVTDKIGENIQREWDEDPDAPELWDALELFKTEPAKALATLTDLAERGSALAMMYLGSAYLSGRDGIETNPVLGQEWLVRSARHDSIEGGFGLACRYDSTGEFGKAEAELKMLAERGYSPAMFLLGYKYYKGSWGQQDMAEALHYLSNAEEAGNLIAGHWLSTIYRKENLGLGKKIVGSWKWLMLLRPWITYCVNYPTSDRLRLSGNPYQIADRLKGRAERRTPAP